MSCDHVKALNLAKEGQLEEAHEIVQAHSDRFACLIHGYLHRVEGDMSNARYWYNRADEIIPDNSLDDEISRIYKLVSA